MKLQIKQELVQAPYKKVNLEKSKTSNRKSRKFSPSVPERGIVTILGKKLSEYWKIGTHWLETVKNLLRMPLNSKNVDLLVSVPN